MSGPRDDRARNERNEAASADQPEPAETDPTATPPPVSGRPWFAAGESKLGIAGAVLGVIGGVLGIWGFMDNRANEREARDAQPSARIERVADGRADGSVRNYPVGLHTDFGFTFHQGNTDLQPLIVVWSASTTGSGRYYPVDPNALTPRTVAGADGCGRPKTSDDWYCGGVTIGAPGDRGTLFVVSVYGAPTQIAGIVRSKVAENDAGAASNGWANLPAGLTPLGSVTVSRK